MLRQYHEIKKQYPGTLLFFRLGDFYELFFDDALIGSREMEITLTARHKERGNPVPMCGVPYHAADGYIARLSRKGYKVAICDQVEDPRKARGLIKREVVRVVSPGTLTDAAYLDALTLGQPSGDPRLTGESPQWLRVTDDEQLRYVGRAQALRARALRAQAR